jgi:ribose transport system permease protein
MPDTSHPTGSVTTTTSESPPALDGQRLVRRRRPGVPWWGRYGVVLTLVLLVVVFTVTTSGFFTGDNFRIVTSSNSIALVVALGALIPLMVGEFDLSVGANVELSSVLVAVLAGQHGWSRTTAAVAGILLGAFIGLVNGVLVALTGMSSFIATLAVSSLASGLSLYLTDGSILFENIPVSLRTFSQGDVGPVPKLLVVAALVALVLWYVTERTPVGRQVISIGLNKEAARLMGIRTRGLVVAAFVASGLLAGLAGVLLLGRVGSASSGVGPSFLLPALAAGFLGATTIKVGRFNVVGTVIAVALVAIGLNGLQLNGVPVWVEPVFDGAVLAVAVGASRLAVLRAAR